MTEQITQEELLERIESLNAEFERFATTTSQDIINLIIEEDYPIPVALGGLCATIDSIIRIYDVEDLRDRCIELIEKGIQDLE